MSRRAASDEDSSFVLCFQRMVPIPPTVRPCENAALLAIDTPATEAMSRLCDYFQVQPDGRTLRRSCAPSVTRQALLTWLRHLGTLLEAAGLIPTAEHQVYPLPVGICTATASRTLTGEVWPDRICLLHILWSLGLSPFTVTAAAILHHHAEGPDTITATTRRHSEGTGESSDHFRHIIQGVAK